MSIVGTAAFVVYVASWAGWLTTSGRLGPRLGRRRTPTTRGWARSARAFASLLNYHREIFAFHTGDYIRAQTHSYDAHPAGWLLMLRPISFDAVNDIAVGTDGCVGPENCVRVVTGMGTPVLWWLAAAALVVALIWWLAGRDWRFGVPVLAAWPPTCPGSPRPTARCSSSTRSRSSRSP